MDILLLKNRLNTGSYTISILASTGLLSVDNVVNNYQKSIFYMYKGLTSSGLNYSTLFHFQFK